MKQYLTIKRTKAGIVIVAEHDDLKAANKYRYTRNTSDQTTGVVYETWTRDDWEATTEHKLT